METFVDYHFYRTFNHISVVAWFPIHVRTDRTDVRLWVVLTVSLCRGLCIRFHSSLLSFCLRAPDNCYQFENKINGHGILPILEDKTSVTALISSRGHIVVCVRGIKITLWSVSNKLNRTLLVEGYCILHSSRKKINRFIRKVLCWRPITQPPIVSCLFGRLF